jgi:hypothetical protein
VHENGKTVIVVSCQLPYDAARFPEADAVLLTYWGSAMREMPAEGSSWSANLPAGLLACFDLIPTEDRPFYMLQVGRQFTQGDMAYLRHEIRRKDGVRIQVACYGRRYYDSAVKAHRNEIIIFRL